jgi:hypothetical protein
MKNIEAVSIWDNGQNKQAEILDAYAVNVSLENSATFWYGLFAKTEDGSKGSQLVAGNVTMSGDDYSTWQEDSTAWAFIATKLGLTIIGDYVAPVPVVEETIVEEVTAEEETVVQEETAAEVIAE